MPNIPFGFRLQVSVENVQEVTETLTGFNRDMRRRFTTVLKQFGEDLIEDLKSEYMSGPPGITPRTGKLRDSLKLNVIDDGDNKTLSITSDSPYFQTHYKGMTIFPITARRLAIPYANTPYLKLWPRYFARGDLKVISNGGRTLLFSTQLRRFTHTLVSSVTIPPRLVWDNFIRRKIDNELSASISDLIEDIAAKDVRRGGFGT